jgi:hypothetical protein
MNPRLQKVVDDEKELIRRGVPQQYWAYLAYNNHDDGLGTWTPDRAWIVKDMERFPPGGVKYAVVDGRDKRALTKHISNSWKGDGCVQVKNGDIVPWTEEDWENEWKEWLVTGKLTRLSLKEVKD